MGSSMSRTISGLFTNIPKFCLKRKSLVLLPLFLLLLGLSTLLISPSAAQNPENVAVETGARTLPASKKSTQLPDPKQCPSCPEPSQQTIYAPTIGMTEATGSEIVLNNRSPNEKTVTNAAIDIGDGTFADLGMTGTGTVLWRFD